MKMFGSRIGVTGALTNLRFRTKIMIGFATVLALSSVSTSSSYLGFNRIMSGVSAYHDISAETDVARDIDRDIAVYALLARYYVLSGAPADETAAKDAEAIFAKTIDRAFQTAAETDKERRCTVRAFYRLFAPVCGDRPHQDREYPDQIQRAAAAGELLPLSIGRIVPLGLFLGAAGAADQDQGVVEPVGGDLGAGCELCRACGPNCCQQREHAHSSARKRARRPRRG